MVCGGGAISWEGKSEMAILGCRQTSSHYVYTIGEYLIPFSHLKYGTEFDFQQDNDPIHTFRETKEFFSQME